MSNLKKYSAILAISSCLIGCASTGPAPYQPVGPNGGFGFQERQIENDRFRVAYTASTPEDANDFALLRASEITKAEGYDHFQIVTGDQSVDGGVVTFTPHIGLGVGSVGYRNRLGASVGIGIPLEIGQEKFRQSFEIKLHQTAGSTPDFFSADEVIRNLPYP